MSNYINEQYVFSTVIYNVYDITYVLLILGAYSTVPFILS